MLCEARPGNLGAILRSATLLGCAVALLGKPSKATLDKAFRYAMLQRRSKRDAVLVPMELQQLKDLKQHQVRLVGLTADVRAKPIWDVDLRGQVWLKMSRNLHRGSISRVLPRFSAVSRSVPLV